MSKINSLDIYIYIYYTFLYLLYRETLFFDALTHALSSLGRVIIENYFGDH